MNGLLEILIACTIVAFLLAVAARSLRGNSTQADRKHKFRDSTPKNPRAR
jgi:type II secretory pathway pseudopilin PulG